MLPPQTRWRSAHFWGITQRVVVIAGPETSVKDYHCSLLNKTEERSTLLLLTISHAPVKAVFVCVFVFVCVCVCVCIATATTVKNNLLHAA
jgi:hypothetical protein